MLEGGGARAGLPSLVRRIRESDPNHRNCCEDFEAV